MRYIARSMLISRTTFAYHYFPSMLFLTLALAYVMDGLVERAPKGWRLAVFGLTGSTVAVYAAFYPVLIGLAVPAWYTVAPPPGSWPSARPVMGFPFS